MTRIWGLGQTFPDYPYNFFKDVTSPQLVIQANTLDEAREIVNEKPKALIWVDVRISREKVAFALSPARDFEFLDHKRKLQEENPQAAILTSGKLTEYPWEQINEFYKNTPALKEFYVQFPETKFILNVVDNTLDVHTSVVAAINDLHSDDRTLVQSEANVIIDNIKVAKPQWVYGTSTPDLVRFLSFESIWLVSAIPFKGDVFIAPFTKQKRPAFNEVIIEEMRRRHKRIFLGPIQTPEQLKQARDLKADAYIYESLEALSQLEK